MSACKKPRREKKDKKTNKQTNQQTKITFSNSLIEIKGRLSVYLSVRTCLLVTSLHFVGRWGSLPHENKTKNNMNHGNIETMKKKKKEKENEQNKLRDCCQIVKPALRQ